MNYSEAVSYLESLVDFERLGFRRHFADTVNLDTIRRLLELLGNPQRGLGCVHIAGTKGKGSTAAILESVLREAGLVTGLFTSPHLVSFRERIRIAGEMATEEEIAWAVEQVQGPIEAMRAEGKLNPSTFFEAYTAMAYLLFRRRGVQVAVMETGLGGRLDATNTCEPVACAITTLGLDHTEILGHTLAEIAREKAGIMKPGVPVVFAPQEREAEAVLREVAAEVGAPLREAPKVLTRREASRLAIPADDAGGVPRPGQEVTVGMREGEITVELPLVGEHQAVNLATVLGLVEALREKGFDISDDAVREGARKLRWPGRLEVVGVRPWVVLDVAHNEPSAKALAGALPGMLEYERLVAVVGLMGEKDAGAFCGMLAPLVEVVVLTQARNPRALPVGELEKACEGMWKRVVVTQSVPEAFEVAKAEAGVRDCVLVTGGLYVVGEVMEELGARAGRH